MFTRKQPETAQKTAATGANTGYMVEFEKWLDEVVFEPIKDALASGDMKEIYIAVSEAKQLLKKKVLASYHNGLKARAADINRKTMSAPPTAEIKRRCNPRFRQSRKINFLIFSYTFWFIQSPQKNSDNTL